MEGWKKLYKEFHNLHFCENIIRAIEPINAKCHKVCLLQKLLCGILSEGHCEKPFRRILS
jgi:hypothetical protein